jgi:hypothetical protein
MKLQPKLLYALVWATTVQATIVTRYNISSVLSEITDQNTLIIFDIDDTLLKTNGEVTEPNVTTIIATLKQRGCKSIGLTARPWASKEHTLKQLADVGISFADSALSLLPMTLNTHEQHPRLQAGYTDGIIFCGYNPKGTMLGIHLLVTGHVPSSIVFIDDMLPFVESVDQVCARLHIPCTAIHYQGARPRGPVRIGKKTK